MSQRLPTPGGDNGGWGTILNNFLGVEHNADGTLKHNLPVVNITQYGAVGNGVYDDASSVQSAIDALGVTGGTIVIPAGTWTWKSVPKIPASITGVLRITGFAGTTIQLTQAGPSAFQFNRTADHQTFQNIEISDLVIDGGSTVIGKYVVVLGNWNQGTQIRMNFDRIAIRRVKTVNVNSDSGSVATTERPNVYLVASQSGTAEATQNTVQRILVEDCDFSGGAHGVVIGGFNTQGNGAAGSLNTNTFCDDIYVNRVRHNTGITPTAYWASANFSLGAVGTAGRCVIRDCHGINAGDPGVESDGWDYFLADNVLIEDAGVSGFLWINYDNPRAATEQKYVWRNCEYRRTNANAGIGWYLRNSNSIALGHLTLRDCSFYQDRSAEVPGVALKLDTNTEFKSCLLDNFKHTHKGFTYSSAGNQQWNALDFTSFTGTGRITIRGLRYYCSGTRSSGGAIVNTIAAFGGGTIYLLMDDVAWESRVTGQTNDTHWAFVLGQGYTTTLHGVARGIRPIVISGDTTPRMFYTYGTDTLTISPDFRLDDLDTTAWPGAGVVVYPQAAHPSNAANFKQHSLTTYP